MRNCVRRSQDESWGSRWLRNNKVNKVLATAKLASKVRSKIKEKKTRSAEESVQREKEEQEAKEAEKPADVEMQTSAEVGSVEHYNELLRKP